MRTLGLGLLFLIVLIGCGEKRAAENMSFPEPDASLEAKWEAIQNPSLPFLFIPSESRMIVHEPIELKLTNADASGAFAITVRFKLATNERSSEDVRFSHQAIFIDGDVSYDINSVAKQPYKVFCAIGQKRYPPYPANTAFKDIDYVKVKAEYSKSTTLEKDRIISIESGFSLGRIPDGIRDRTLIYQQKSIELEDTTSASLYCGYFMKKLYGADEAERKELKAEEQTHPITMDLVLKALGSRITVQTLVK